MTLIGWKEPSFQASFCHASFVDRELAKKNTETKTKQRRQPAWSPGDLHRYAQANSADEPEKTSPWVSSVILYNLTVNGYVFTCPWGKSLYCVLSNTEEFRVSSGRSGAKVKLITPNALSVLHHLTDFKLEVLFYVQCCNSRKLRVFFISCSFNPILLHIFCSVAKL